MAQAAGKLYDRTGAIFSLDHEHGGTAYVRPFVKVIVQSVYGDEMDETEDFEPADYLVAMDRSALFDAPPLAVVNEEIAAKKAELDALKAAEKKAVREINSERSAAERELQAAKRQFAEWMETHRVMLDLGKLLDGQKLYPLSVRENQFHHGREIPRIPEMRSVGYLTVASGDFEKGQKWVCKRYSSDCYGNPFRFYDTKEERDAVIVAEFDAACQSFRKAPNFDTTTWSTGTTLHYGTLMEWVKTHPSLAIPADIEGLKAAHDAKLVEARKAMLAAELAKIEAA